MSRLFCLVLGLALAGCAQTSREDPPGSAAGTPQAAANAAEGQVRPVARPSGLRAAPKPPAAARTAEQFDTTSAADRAKAAAAPADPTGERRLGVTVATLGDPSKPGFWLETPLAAQPGTGRVVFPGTGQSSQVELIPIDGPATAGSRISLAAMRLIGAPLTGLPEIEVYSGG